MKLNSILSFLIMIVSATSQISFANPYNLFYSGRLTETSGAPIQGPIDIEVKFFSSETGDDEIGVTVPVFSNVLLSEGAFGLNFDLSPATFNTIFSVSSSIWIQVRDVTHDQIYPRQTFSAVPYAMKVPIDNQTIGYNSDGELTLLSTADVGTSIIQSINSSGSPGLITAAHLPGLAGDVTGSIISNQVTKIRGHAVADQPPNNGEYLQWDGGSSSWKPTALSGANGGTVTQVASGTGLTGGPITATGTLSLADSGITAGTYTKVTVDAKGRATSGTSIAAADLPSNIDAAKIAGGGVDNTEFGFLDGVTSSIQSQLTGKLSTTHNHDNANPTFTSLTTADLSPGITIGKQDNNLEGGEIKLNGAGSHDFWIIDTYNNILRFFSNSVNNNSVNISNVGSGKANLNVEGNINATTVALNLATIDANDNGVAYISATPSVTSSASYSNNGLAINLAPLINSGVTDSGLVAGIYNNTFRSSTSDLGILSSLAGEVIQYGHAGSTAWNTTNAFGLHITPFHQSGTITNSYGLYLNYAQAGGTATNYYGIYQIDPLAKNHFGGYVGIGTTSPSSALHVVGGIRKDIGAFSGGTSAWQMVNNDGAGNWSEYINSTGTASPTLITEGAAYKQTTSLNTVASNSNYLTYQYANPGAAGSAITWKDYMAIDAVNNVVSLLSSGGTFGGSVNIGSVLNVGGTQSTNTTANYYNISNTPITDISGTGVNHVISIHNTPSIDSSTNDPNLGALTAFYGRTNTQVGYTGTITNSRNFVSAPPSINGSNKIPAFYGFLAQGVSNTAPSNSGNTSGELYNINFYSTSHTAEAGVGGTLHNYGALIEVPNGSGTAGTTNNYGLSITGNSTAGDVNYSIYNGSTSPSYFAGNIGIGTTSPIIPLHIEKSITGPSGYVGFFNNTADSTTGHGISIRAGSNTASGAILSLYQRPDGSTIGSVLQSSATTVSYNTTSDKRLKENIIDAVDGLNLLHQIKVRDYNYIADPEKITQQGFIAQELYPIYPQAVTVGGDDPKISPWQVDYGKMTPLLVKATQEIDLKVNTLQKDSEKEINLLKEENIKLKAKLDFISQYLCSKEHSPEFCRE